MSKILHTGDVHIKEEGDERWNALLTILDEADKEKVDYVVISGDLFHKDANADLARHKLRPAFEGRRFKTLIIAGNHDTESYGEGTWFGENVLMLLDKPYHIHSEDDVRFIGIPYDDVTAEKVLDIVHQANEEINSDKTNVFLFHGDLADIQHGAADMGEDEQSKRYMPARLAYFKDTHADYVLAGHYHTNFSVNEFGKGKFFIYPGSPVSTTKKEVGKRKVNLLTLGKPPVEHNIDTFYYQHVSVTLEADDKEPIRTIEEAVKKSPPGGQIVLTIHGFTSLEEEVFHKQLQKFCKDNKILQSENFCRNIEHITSTDVYKAFQYKLRKHEADEKTKEAANEYLFKAAAKVMR